MKPLVQIEDLGRIEYNSAWDYQYILRDKLIQQKRSLNGKPSDQKHFKIPNYLLFCEHPHVYTLGKSGDISNLLINENQLKEKQAKFLNINRGGDITYHGPGQVVLYPILDLDQFFTDVHRYVRSLEEIVIRTLNVFDIDCFRVPEFTGVWTSLEGKNLKLCAIGVHLSRWVTMHGLALNVNTNLDYFGAIVPCGIDHKDFEVTSMSQMLNQEVELKKVKHELINNFGDVFDCDVRMKNEINSI